MLALAVVSCGGGGGGGDGDGGTGTGLEINTGVVDFTASQNGPVPPGQSVQVTITAADAYYIIAGYPPAAAVPSWLDLSLSGSGSAWTLSFRINQTSLAEGSYSATVRVLCARSDESVIAYRDLTVRYTVSNLLNVTPLSLDFSHVRGASSAPVDQFVRVDGVGIDWTARADMDWVQLGSTGGTTTSDLSIGVDPAGLGVGTHSAIVTVADGEDSFDVDVTLEVQAPAFQFGVSSLNFDGINGANIAAQTLTVALNSGGNATWTATSSDTWLVLDMDSGTTPDPISVSVDPAIASLSGGSYSGSITLSGSFNGEPLSAVIPVQFNLTVPSLNINASSLTFSGINGGDISSRTLTVELDSGANLSWSAATSDIWLVLDKDSGTTPDAISVSVDPAIASLPSGSHSGSITLSGSYNGDPLSAVIPVQLDLTAPSMTVNVSSLTFSGINGANVAAQTLAVALDSGGNGTWTATSSDTWLVLDKRSGTTPDMIGVSIDPAMASLPSGSHSGTISLNGSYNGDPLSAVVTVQLTLTAPTIAINPESVVLGGSDGLDLSPQALLQFSLSTGSNSYPWTATLDTVSGTSWLVADTTSGTVSSTPVGIDLSATRTVMTGGIYDGTITITATVNGDSVVATAPVTLNIEYHRLFVADNGVALSSMPTMDKLTHVIEVQDTYGLTTTGWSATSDQSWLSVTASGNAGDDLTLTAEPSGLAADMVHFADITISSSESTIENSETVRVGFWVGSTDPSSATSIGLPYSELVSDPIRPYAYVHDEGTDIGVYNVYTGALVTTIADVAPQLGPMVVSNDGSTLYASDLTNSQIVSVDLDAQSVGAAWNLVSSPSYMRLAYARPKGYAIVLASDGAAYDAIDGTQLLLDPPFIAAINNIATSLDGTVLYIYSSSPSYINRYNLTYTALSEQELRIELGTSTWASCPVRDLAVSLDGLRLYSVCGGYYAIRVYDGETLIQEQTLPASAYPNNVEIGANGLFYGGIHSMYGPTDVWVYNSVGTEQATYYLSGYAAEILDRQLAVSGDGLRIIVLTSDPTLQFVSGP